jgi:tripartite-type tricarboxylate transporter receptor subunit TctC
VKFSTTGIGATSWVNTVVLTKEVGITPQYVHYTNTADAMLSVIPATPTPARALLQHPAVRKSGDVKLILLNAPSAPRRPQRSTIAEEGYPGLATPCPLRASSAARETPPEVMTVLDDAFGRP